MKNELRHCHTCQIVIVQGGVTFDILTGFNVYLGFLFYRPKSSLRHIYGIFIGL